MVASGKSGDGVTDELENLRAEVRMLRARLAAQQRPKQSGGIQQDMAAMFQLLTESVPHLMGYVDSSQRYQFINTASNWWFNRSPGEILGKQISELMTLEEYAEVQSYIQQVLQGERVDFERKTKNQDGKIKNIRGIYSPDFDQSGKVIGFFVMAEDISERKQVEEELRASRRLLQAIFDTIPDQVFVKDRQSHYLMVNRAWGNMFNIAPEDANKFTAEQLPVMETNFMQEVRKTDQGVLERGETQIIPKLEIKFPDGTEQYRRVFKAPLFLEDGTIEGIVGFSTDITESVQAEKEIRRLNEHLEQRIQERTQELEGERNFIGTIMDTQEALVVVSRPNGEIVQVNKSCERLTGYSQSEIVENRELGLIFPPELLIQLVEKTQNTRLGTHPIYHENVIHEKGGTVYDIAWATNTVSGKDGTVEYIISAGIDISERKRLEAELLKQEKMATLGKLIAVVSHELRNPLATIQASLFTLASMPKIGESKQSKLLERMNRNIARCNNIIDEMLDYTREQKFTFHPVLMDEWIRAFLGEQPTAKDVILTTSLHADGVMVDLATERFQRVMVNLIQNACQAMMPDNFSQGDLKSDLPSPQLHIATEKLGDGVQISISDNGPGIPDEIREKIFEPMFSTKNFGVGLGLPIVKHIMGEHGGDVKVCNLPKRGARFDLWFPLSKNLQG